MIIKQLKQIGFIALLLSLSACIPSNEGKKQAESNTANDSTSETSDSSNTNTETSPSEGNTADSATTINNGKSGSTTREMSLSDSASISSAPATIRQKSFSPLAPENIHIERGNGIVRIAWQAVEEADYYNIYMQTANNNDASLIKQTQNAQETEFFVEENNEPLSIYIRSVQDDIESSPSTLVFVSKLLTTEEDTATGSTTIKNNNGK